MKINSIFYTSMLYSQDISPVLLFDYKKNSALFAKTKNNSNFILIFFSLRNYLCLPLLLAVKLYST